MKNTSHYCKIGNAHRARLGIWIVTLVLMGHWCAACSGDAGPPPDPKLLGVAPTTSSFAIHVFARGASGRPSPRFRARD